MERVNIPEPIRRHPAVWWSRFKLRWPMLVWLAAIAVAVTFYIHGGQLGGMSGTVEALHEEVAPVEAARLKAVHVKAGQVVRAGDLLAEMDTTVLDTQMAVERLDMESQFARAEARAESALADAVLREAETRGELEVLNGEVERLDQLLARQLVDAQTVARLRARQKALAEAAPKYLELIQTLKRELDTARQRKQDLEAGLGAAARSGGSTAVDEAAAGADASRQRLGWLDLRRSAYALRAGAAGVVTRIYHEPGNVVAAGLPIMTIVRRRADHIVGFLSEHDAQAVYEGMEAWVTRASGGPVVHAKVEAVIPEIVTLPNRINPFATQVYRGRRVIIAPDGPHDLLPGEGVSIFLHRPWLTILVQRLTGRATFVPGSGP